MLDLRSFNTYAGYISANLIKNQPVQASYYREFYQMLKAYRMNNDLYTFINESLQATRISNKDIKPLRNPANRTIEFYAAKLWPGSDIEIALPIIAEDESIVDPIYRIYGWSNFAVKKQAIARQFATLGDMIIKINVNKNDEGEATAVWQEFVDPTYASEIRTDERGYVTYIRLDIPKSTIENSQIVDYVYTEEWDKETQEWRIWIHEQNIDEEIEKLGEPDSRGTFEESYGEDFVPFVYQSFREDGEGRGNGAFVPVLDKIDEINAKATRLAQMLFRYGRADKALVSETTDKSGRPLAPPNIDALTESKDGVTSLVIKGERFFRLPSGWKMENIIANLDYDAHLKAIDSDTLELEQDLPELAYGRLVGSSNVSEQSLRYMLDAAVSRLLESRGNGEAAFVRANQMALTIADNLEVPGFENLPDYESGGLDHKFAPRPVLAPDRSEQAETAKAWAAAGATNFTAVAEYTGVPEDVAVDMARSDLEPVLPEGVER